MNARARAVRNEFLYLSGLAAAPLEGRNGTEKVQGASVFAPYSDPSGVVTLNYPVTRQPHRGRDVYILHCEFVPLG